MTSTVQVVYDPDGDNIDITDNVLFADATFEMQMNAVPGTCSFRVVDEAQVYSFVTGRELRLFIDSIPMWGGYLRRVNRTFPFSADDTSDPENYENRIWLLEGVDYNILLDNVIMRNTSNYKVHLPNNTGYVKGTMDGWALWKMLYSFSDFPAGFGITSDRADAAYIDDIKTVLPASSTSKFFYKQQGTKIRDQFDLFAGAASATFYIGADKTIHFHAWESVEKRWGFSDNPTYNAITASPASYQAGADWGFHEVTGEEDGSMIVNDAIIWGGSAFGGASVLYARETDEDSIDDHGRWQIGEVHFEGGGYGNQDGVDARANTIINGPPGTDAKGLLKGLRFAQWKFSFSWWADEVPLLSGVPDHILAGNIVFISLATFGASQFAPCRTLRITFPGLDPEGDAFVLLSGDFSFAYTDSIGLWKSLLGAKSPGVQVSPVTVVGDSSDTSAYGDYATLSPQESPDGSRVAFTIKFPYISDTLVVYLNGLMQRRDTDYEETDPDTGTFTMTSAPDATDIMIIKCRTQAYP